MSSHQNLFLPINKDDLKKRGWKKLDIIIISGDAYIDHPSFGAALVGRYLESNGFKVGIIPQPDWNTDEDFLALGQPSLFVGISAGNVDSMLCHYTANKKLRRDDAYTEGNLHGKRPNRSVTVYANKVKQLMPGVPIVLGGLEASMRRLAHYDYWSDSVRRSILLDTRADVLVYGMGEKTLLEIANTLKAKKKPEKIRGTAHSYTAKNFIDKDFVDSIQLPSFEDVKKDKNAFFEMSQKIDQNINPYNAKTLIQETSGQFIVVNPPQLPLTTNELDAIYDQPFTRQPHPIYKETIPAFEMIKDSITAVRGCSGGCSFCSIGLHQGKLTQSRSESSILKEVEAITRQKDFKGTISDLGGPSANLYASFCADPKAMKACKRPSCLHPSKCKNLKDGQEEYISLLRKVRNNRNIKRVNISSGIRYDIAMLNDTFIKELVKYHTPGHLKLAPEHTDDKILTLMRKPPFKEYEKFCEKYFRLCRQNKKELYPLPYLIASFPGCTQKEMKHLAGYLKKNRIKVEQSQDFIPLPMTAAAAMYYTERDLSTGKSIPIAKTLKERQAQRRILTWWKDSSQAPHRKHRKP